jgi:hypothetical protein
MNVKKRLNTKLRKRPRGAKKPARPKAPKKVSANVKDAVGKSRVKTSTPGGKRNYSTGTIKKLFALCGNQCAFPECTNEIVTPGTKWSDPAVLGHICHIYASSDNGPRGKPGLTESERNSFSNLILMCGHHHPKVDKQWQTYPAAILKEWKRTHEAKAMPGTAEAIKRNFDIEKHVFFEQKSDEEIDAALARILHGRFLVGFATADETKILAKQVEQSRFSSGSALKRARALAWCARILASGDTIERATELLRQSTELAGTPEAAIAQAFIMAASDSKAAVASLAAMRTPESLSAALRIVSIKDGTKKAQAWALSAGISVKSFDAEGKLAFMINALADAEWSTAMQAINHITETDFVGCPVLLHTVAMARLLTTVPEELRTVAFAHVPFDADTFPLASKPENLAERRMAQSLFERVSEFARDVGVNEASNLASDYALWLRLRDPDRHEAALLELRASMTDPAQILRRLNFAIRFGLKVDVATIEERIDQGVALSGKGTADEALARFALAFIKETPRAAADYIEKHRSQLYAHLQKPWIIGFEIESLARAGLVATAREKLQQAVQEGLSARDQSLLQTMLAEMSGSDPIAERRALYEATHELRALVNLVGALETAKLWQDMLPYAEALFAATASVETYERLAVCMSELGRNRDLLASMSKHRGLIDQSENLKSIWAWALYFEGRFAKAAAALQKLSNSKHPNARALRVNIAIASGAWDELLEFCQETWEDRNKYSARDLMHAAHISVVLNGPHSRDLVVAATEKEPNDPRILAGAYFQATSAGWEQNLAVAEWLRRAAELSGDDGPLKSMSMQELLEKKPAWDKQAEFVWEQLKLGKIPTFAAGQLLNRSVLEFYLLPSLANPTEVDVRKRSLIFAYSGARMPVKTAQPKTLAIDLAALITFSRLDLLDNVLSRYLVVVPHSTLRCLFQEREKATFHQPSRIQSAAEVRQFIANGTLNIIRPAASQDHRLARQVGVDLASLLSAAHHKSTAASKVLVVRSSPLPRLGSALSEEADVTGYEGYLCSCGAVIDRLMRKAALTQPEEQIARDYLKLHERAWPSEPVIDDNTEIYLDGLSVTYLQTAGVLGKFKAAGLKAYIGQSEDRDADALLELEHFGKRQLAYIEQIRNSLARGLVSGRVSAAPTTQESDDDLLPRSHPTFGVLGLVGVADALVVDDRFINQHPNMTNESGTVPVLSSLDVLDLLRGAGALTTVDLLAKRTILRQAGYQLIAVREEELLHHVKNAVVANGELIETAELKAIRESLLRARMSALVQLPTETNFLHGMLSAYVNAIKETWETTADRAEAEIRANYLLAQFDIRKWAASAISGGERGFALYGYAGFILQITTPPLKAGKALREVYYAWVTNRVLEPVKRYQLSIYEWIVARSREMVVGLANDAAREFASKQ